MDFYKFLERQKREDRQAFIVHFPAASGKTRFAKRLCQLQPGLVYIDLLERYLSTPDLPAVHTLDPEGFEHWVLQLKYPPGTHTLILDQGDFLFNTWTTDEKQQFINWLRQPLRTPTVTPHTLIFFIQTDGILSAAELTNSHSESRVLKLSEFDAL